MRRFDTVLTLSVFLLTLWLSEASHGESVSIPRSNQRIFREKRRYPPWNASPSIDDEGFLLKQYKRLPGEWESIFHPDIQRRFQKHIRSPTTMIRQVPGDGNVSKKKEKTDSCCS